MPNISDHKATNTIKMLYVGDSGCGKTGALASLATAGYKLRIIDADNGIDSLAAALAGKPGVDVEYVTTVDKKTSVKLGKDIKIVTKGGAKAFGAALDLLNHWKYKDKAGNAVDLGKPEQWGTDTILVIDTLDHLGTAALDYVLELEGRGGAQPYQGDWGTAMRQLEQLIQLLSSDAVGCHVIINSHVAQVATEHVGGTEVFKGYPAALGSKLPPKIGAYFNVVIVGKKQGTGSKVKRVFSTVPTGNIDAKNPNTKIASELPIEDGLATFFKQYLGTSPKI